MTHIFKGEKEYALTRIRNGTRVYYSTGSFTWRSTPRHAALYSEVKAGTLLALLRRNWDSASGAFDIEVVHVSTLDVSPQLENLNRLT